MAHIWIHLDEHVFIWVAPKLVRAYSPKMIETYHLVISFPILSTIHMYRAPICILYVITRKMPERQGELFNMQITTAFFVRLTSTLVKSC